VAQRAPSPDPLVRDAARTHHRLPTTMLALFTPVGPIMLTPATSDKPRCCPAMVPR